MIHKKISVLMYSHDGFGLGHLKRNFTIASYGIRALANSRFLLLTGSPSFPFSHFPHGVDVIKLPSIIKVHSGVWDQRTLSIEPEDFRNLRVALIKDAAQYFRPDIFLIDYMPSGVWNELIPTFKLLKSSSHPPKIILGLRDILDDPQLTIKNWQEDGIYDLIRDYYDRIFIYGSSDVFETAYHYNLLNDFAEKVVYCGYVSSTSSVDEFKVDRGLVPSNVQNENCRGTSLAEHYSPRKMKNDLHLQPDEKLILITAGGGYDAFPMMDLTIKALKYVFPQILAKAVLITGPLMSTENQAALEMQAQNQPIHIFRSAENINYMCDADLVITMAGYNTLMDALNLRKNIIVIPRVGPSVEQHLRAQLFSRLHYVETLNPPPHTDPSELAKMILRKLTHPEIPPLPLRIDGTKNVIHQMENLLTEKISEQDSLIGGLSVSS